MKVYLLLLIPVLLCLKEKRVVVSASITLALMCAASCFFLPDALWPDWLALSFHNGGYGKQVPDVMTIPWNQSINGFFIREFLDRKISGAGTQWLIMAYAMASAVLLLTVAVIIRYLRQCDRGRSLALSLILLAITLIAPLTWLHHFVFALPAVASSMMLAWQFTKTPLQKLACAATATCAFLISYPWVANAAIDPEKLTFVNRSLSLAGNLVLSTPMLAGAVLWLLLILMIIRERAKAGMS